MSDKEQKEIKAAEVANMQKRHELGLLTLLIQKYPEKAAELARRENADRLGSIKKRLT